MEHKKKKTIKTDGRKLLLDALKLIGISRGNIIIIIIIIIIL
jgi:hypothetical protein